MTPLHKSRTERIESFGHQPKKGGSSPPKLNRCAIIGDPLRWLEKNNLEVKIMEIPKGLKR